MALDTQSKRKLNYLALIAVFLLLAFGAFSVFVVARIAFAYVVPSPNAVTAGRVIHFKPGYRGSQTQCWVSYEVDGKKYTNNRAGCGWRASVGDEVDVLYQTTNPEKSAVDSRMFANLFGLLTLLLVIAAYISIRKFKKL